MKSWYSLLLLFHILTLNCFAQNPAISMGLSKKSEREITTGAQQTEKYLPELRGKRVGVVANHTSMIYNRHLIDTLLSLKVNVKAIFSPEHGFMGNEADGKSISNQQYPKTGIPIISLFGSQLKPDPTEIKNLDIIIFDIQDVGVRFYTYISTMYYMMQACADLGKQVIILDRPNPNGHFIDGPIMNDSLKSFVGIVPVPIVHGCTIAELALMINGENWLKTKRKCKLTVIPCRNYSHRDLVQLPEKPSPNLVSMASVYLYPTLGLFEGTAISVGRGTYAAFELIGHPRFCDGDTTFIPQSIKGMSDDPPLKGEPCKGVNLKYFGEQYVAFAGSIQLHLIIDVYNCFKNSSIPFFKPYFDKLAGNNILRQQIEQGLSEEKIRASWQNDLNNYKSIRKKYLLYEDFE